MRSVPSYTNVVPLSFNTLPTRKHIGLSQATESNEWKAGDWESDIKALESAVALCNASTDLAQKERLDLLDYFALQRRDLIPDIIHFIIRPIIMAWCLTFVSTMPFSTSRKLSSALIWTSNVHFWTMCFSIPVFHNILAKVKPLQRRRKSEWEMEYIDPRDDTSDSSRCLLENWAMSFYPMALFGLVTSTVVVSRSTVHNISTTMKHRFPHPILMAAVMFAQLLTRLGSVASMYQFPKYLYDLQRETLKRPIPLLPACLCSLKRFYMSMLQIGFAADVCQLYHGMKKTTMVNPFLHFHLLISRRKWLFWDLQPPREKVVWVSLCSLFLATVLMAVGQLVAFQKLVRVGYFTKISLATPEHLLKELLKDPDASKTKLRYRLNWREPKRIFSSFRRCFQRFWLFLFSGWGEDASIVSESVETPYLLTLIKNDMEKGLYNDPKSTADRGEWISEASKKMAEIHQQNYDNNSFEDPLGIAFYKTFGVGMSLDFDHDGKLNEGESPSVHRLRARAVKSAIKRYNQIPAMVERDLEKMGGKSDKETIKRKLVREERMRLKTDVMRLLELIPSNAPTPEGKELDVLSMRHSEIFSSGSSLLPFLESVQSMDDQDSDIDPYLGDDIFGNENNIIS
jgi:hypothetical protein